ncbi:unnamed protein product [Schistosoma curassoni]|uniref:GLOBIN domain-containing protein n=1 Tax=Schistosoma curassoni TaxID=6186 RepID=A0A183JIG5_9TREM|nr:unnamed protein product [Schistosoma curassoni]
MFHPHAAEQSRPLIDLLHGNPRKLELNDAMRTAFSEIKTALAQVTLIAHPDPSAVDAWGFAIRTFMKQNISGSWQSHV